MAGARLFHPSGYEAVRLPNGCQLCMPETEPECLFDADCPTIYGISEPRPQLRLVARVIR